MLKVGEATITRVEETNVPSYKLRDVFTELTDAQFDQHKHWLAPHHYEAESACIRLSVHSWLLKVGGKTILIDSCCGNNKNKPGRPFWHMLNVNYLERLAAAGARPQDIDMVMCTHLHHDHVGWNTQQRDGKWVPTFPECALRLQQARHRLLLQNRCRSQGRSGRTRHVPRMRGADPRIRQGRRDRGCAPH